MPVETRKVGYSRGTYAASSGYFTPVATPTDVVGLINSSATSVTGKLVRITMSATITSAAVMNFQLLLRSTADTGSTPVTIRPITTDQSTAASKLTCVQYSTTNPTPGTPVNTTGLLKLVTLVIPSATTPTNLSADDDQLLWDDNFEGQPITLRTGGQGVYVNLNGAALGAGFQMCVNLIWTEE
jgi:hypothetical protein